MTGKLAGKTALVTGASRGIGAEIARTLAARGALTAVHYGASKAEAEAVVAEIQAAGGKAFTVHGDLAEHAQVLAMFEELDAKLWPLTGGGLDILVNNAGRGGGGSLMQTTEDEFDKVFDLNVKGTYFVTQEAARRLRENGRVVNISSAVGRGAQGPRLVYAASKWALNGLTLSMAQELAPKRITVNAVAPGAVFPGMIQASVSDPAFTKAVISMTAFERLGAPQDIAEVVAFLASPAAGWVTAQIIEASGGLRL